MELTLAILAWGAAMGLSIEALRRLYRWRRPIRADVAVHDAHHSRTIILDVEGVEPERASVRRLVEDAARRAMRDDRDLVEVDVVDRVGTRLGHIAATHDADAVPPYPVENVPPRGRSRQPDLYPPISVDQLPAVPPPHFDARERPGPRLPLAYRFDLPQAVRDRLHDPHDAVDLIRAIMLAGGHAPRVDDDLLICDDEAFVVVSARGAIHTDALSHAYHRFRDSGAARGTVISFGRHDPADIRRRELLAPELRHVGSTAVQRMADAVAVGSDPLRFVTATPLRMTAAR